MWKSNYIAEISIFRTNHIRMDIIGTIRAEKWRTWIDSF